MFVENPPPAGKFPAAPPSPRVTWHEPFVYPDMSVVNAQFVKDDVLGFKLGAPQ